MKRVEVATYPVSIFIATGFARIEHVQKFCREHCDEHGLCVTITPTQYCYTGGEEAGVIVGLINYPRFPSSPVAIWQRAEQLGAVLREQLKQESYTIQAPDKTVWFSHRSEDAA